MAPVLLSEKKQVRRTSHADDAGKGAVRVTLPHLKPSSLHGAGDEELMLLVGFLVTKHQHPRDQKEPHTTAYSALVQAVLRAAVEMAPESLSIGQSAKQTPCPPMLPDRGYFVTYLPDNATKLRRRICRVRRVIQSSLTHGSGKLTTHLKVAQPVGWGRHPPTGHDLDLRRPLPELIPGSFSNLKAALRFEGGCFQI
jgi:hypothetical protein